MRDSVVVNGVWLRISKTDAHEPYNVVSVLVEVDGVWREVITETACDGPVSHISEPAGIRQSPEPEWLK